MVTSTTVRTDAQIEQDVRQELIWDYRVDATDVSVSVTNGTVILSGAVPSYTQRNLASTDAWKIGGVMDVNNLLTVRYPTTVTVPADAEIKADVETALALNATVDSSDIAVSVANGTVTLDGTVSRYWEKRRAEDLASDLTGVVMVDNHLTVVPTQDFEDQIIAEDVEAALERNLYVVAEEVTVEVEDGVVTLSGTVPTYHARAEAFNAAASTPGVVIVNNNLTVV
jgi:osmotically-inducible protein OsmY